VHSLFYGALYGKDLERKKSESGKPNGIVKVKGENTGLLIVTTFATDIFLYFIMFV
jgi:hypothetical protein